MIPSVRPLENQTRKARASRVQFGATSAGGGMATRFFSGMEKQPILELGFKDVAAFSLPRLALSRNWKEFMDMLPLEASNISITMLSSLVLMPLMRIPVKSLNKELKKKLETSLGAKEAEQYLKHPFSDLVSSKVRSGKALSDKTMASVKLARLAASFGFLFPFASAFWAAPFFRNWITLKRTNSANFESIIGFGGMDNNKPKRSQEEEVRYQGTMALKVLGTGFGLGMGSLLLLSGAARKMASANAGKWLESLSKKLKDGKYHQFFDSFDLKGAASNQIKGRPAQLLFWGLPAYLGWMHAARGGNEFRERVIQSANAVFWFFFAAKLTTPVWKQVYQKVLSTDLKQAGQALGTAENKTVNKLLDTSYADLEAKFKNNPVLLGRLRKLKNWKSVLNDYGVPIGSLSAVQFMNYALTEKKIRQAQDIKPLPAAPAVQSNSVNTPGGLPPVNPEASPLFTQAGWTYQHSYGWQQYGGQPFSFNQQPQLIQR